MLFAVLSLTRPTQKDDHARCFSFNVCNLGHFTLEDIKIILKIIIIIIIILIILKIIIKIIIIIITCLGYAGSRA